MKKLITLLSALLITLSSAAQDFERTNGMRKVEGFQVLYFDDATDKVYLEVSRLNEDFLHVSSLSSGIGSNDIGLDRGQLGPQRVVRFEKMGNRIYLIQPNLDYRGSSTNERTSRRSKIASTK